MSIDVSIASYQRRNVPSSEFEFPIAYCTYRTCAGCNNAYVRKLVEATYLPSTYSTVAHPHLRRKRSFTRNSSCSTHSFPSQWAVAAGSMSPRYVTEGSCFTRKWLAFQQRFLATRLLSIQMMCVMSSFELFD